MASESHPQVRWSTSLWAALVVVIATTFVLRHEGRRWWCACDQMFLWTSSAWSEHTSQHLFDPYTFTHLLHGFVFWWLLAWWSTPRRDPFLLLTGVVAESAWEVLENSQFIIDRYRAATAAIGYSGDSVVNSLSDILSCSLGLLLARWLGWRKAFAVFIATEVILVLWIRDNLLLNVLMLICQPEALKQWQMGG